MELKLYRGEIKQTGEGEGEAVFATLDVVDKDGDIIRPGAVGEQQAALVPAHAWQNVPLGKVTTFERGNEAIARFKMNMESETGREWFSALKFDLENGEPLQEWSFGFSVKTAGFELEEAGADRELKELDIHEVSPVLLGAGRNTRTLSLKRATDEGNKQPRLVDEIATVRDGATKLAERIAELRAMREGEGRPMSNERKGQIKDLAQQLDELNAAAKALWNAIGNRQDATGELARFEAARSQLLRG